MGIPNKTTPIAGDNRHYGAGYLRTPADTVGPARQQPRINTAAQTNRAAEIDLGIVGTTNPREIRRDELPNQENYGSGG